MAIVFDLQIEFLDTEFELKAFSKQLQKRITPFGEIGFHPLGNTFVTASGPYRGQLSVTPKNVGFGVSLDQGDGCLHQLDDDECLKLSLHMYDFIRDLPYYQLALVGWEIGFLRNFLCMGGNGNVLAVDEIEGLVVANSLLEKVSNKKPWVRFDKDHKWIPLRSAVGNIFAEDDDV